MIAVEENAIIELAKLLRGLPSADAVVTGGQMEAEAFRDGILAAFNIDGREFHKDCVFNFHGVDLEGRAAMRPPSAGELFGERYFFIMFRGKLLCEAHLKSRESQC